MQLPVRIIKHDPAIHSQDLARGCELLASNRSKLVICFRCTAMCRRLPGREAEEIDFGTAFMVEPQRPTKRRRFIVWMGSHAEDARHAKDCKLRSFEPRAIDDNLQELGGKRQPGHDVQEGTLKARSAKLSSLFQHFLLNFFHGLFEHEAQYFLRDGSIPHGRK